MKKRRALLRAGESRLLWAAVPAGVLLFAVVIFAVWEFAQVGRSLDSQAFLSAAAYAQHDRLLQMVNEETGVRGYVATGDPVYLHIYYESQRRWTHDNAVVAQTQSAIPQLQQKVRRSLDAANAVQTYFGDEIALMRGGKAADARRGLSTGRMLFDRLRSLDAQVQQAADTQVNSQRAHTRLLARIGFSGSIAVCAILAVWIVAFTVMARKSKMYRLAAMRDPLTGVQNRSGAIAALDVQTNAAPAQSFGLVFIDLDGFKKINDVYGHATGDTLLRVVAQRLQAEVRAGDSVCRLGGDEFVCVIGAPASPEDVRTVAQRLRRAVCRPYEIGGDSYVVGCSIGVSMHPQHGTTAESLLARADSAMYAAKASGGGVTVFTSPSPPAGSVYV
jgi:diguanylate cyclase (GGDEF)-like protein